MTQFGVKYAECYDLIHQQKDYSRESSELVKYLRGNFPDLKSLKILDFGCGTGGHIHEMVKLGLDVSGFDINENMLKVARNKLSEVDFHSDIEKLKSKCNLVYSLFDVITYQIDDQMLSDFLSAIYESLNVGGSLICDGWHLDGVVANPPKTTIREILRDNSRISRKVIPSSINHEGVIKLKIQLKDETSGEIIANEAHYMRPMSTQHIEAIANQVGFSKIKFMDGGNWSNHLEKNSWRFVMFAQKL